MSRHQLNRICLLSCPMILALLCTHARAQSIPGSWKLASDVEAHRADIAKAVAAKVAKLQSDESETQKVARQFLVDQVGGTQSPSASFMDVYADVIDNALENLVNPKKAAATQPASIRIRLNAAIINAEVAKRAFNARQSGVTALFLRDPSEAVVLWGMKAAKYELPAQLSQLKVMRKPELLKAVLDAVRAHPLSGPIADEAFIALSLDAADPALKNASNDVIQELIPQIIDLMTFRASLFGDSSPPDLTADIPAINFVARTKVRSLETPDQRHKVMTVLYTYVAGSGKLLPDASSDAKFELLDSIHRISRAFEVLDDSNVELVKAAKAVEAIGADAKADDIEQRLTALKTAVDSGPPAHVATH